LNRYFLFLIALFCIAVPAAGQLNADTLRGPADTIAGKDTAAGLQQGNPPEDSLRKTIVYDSALLQSVQHIIFPKDILSVVQRPAGFVYKSQPAVTALPVSPLRKINGKEYLFYLLVLLFILFAILRRAFPKYFSDLFRLFFKTTLKQRQLREQLMQTPLPSLLFNTFFVISGGLYITFLLEHFSINPLGSFWLTFLYACMGLAACYFVKYAGLRICGWLFRMEEASDSYIFIVFIVNKMVGILLLPFLLVLAFSAGDVYISGLALSWCLIGCLLIYRFILTFGAVRNQVRLNLFHFFLYICAFEIAPLLLVYKALLIFFNQTT
jgi:hypothetical protein